MTSTPTKPVDNVVIATKGLQDRNTNITAGTTVENKGKLILRIYLFIYLFKFLNESSKWLKNAPRLRGYFVKTFNQSPSPE